MSAPERNGGANPPRHRVASGSAAAAERRQSLTRRRLTNSLNGSAGPRRLPPAAATGSAATVATQDTARYWRALSTVDVLASPLGVAVGEMEVDTVVKEAAYFIDAFGAAWIGCEADDVVCWVRRQAETGLAEAAEDALEPVVEEKATNADGAEAEQTRKDPPAAPGPLDVASNPLKHDLAQLSADVANVTIYWTHEVDADRPPPGRDWNTEYQSLLEDLVLNPQCRDTDAIRDAIRGFYVEFSAATQDVVSQIVDELATPASERTIPAMRMGVYFHDAIYYRLCLDNDGVYGGDENAMKVAGQQAKAAGYWATHGPRRLLHTPLRVVMTYMGFRVVASTIPPISTDSLVAGSLDGGVNVTAPTGIVASLLADACEDLNLKPRDNAACGLPCDASVFVGKDERFYVMNTARLLPPRVPPTWSADFNGPTDGLACRLRPELLPDMRRPLNPDAFVPSHTTAEDNAEVSVMTQWLRDVGIPTVAAVLSFMEPTAAQTDVFTCTATGAECEDQLSFVVCTSEDECCRICPQAVVDLVKMSHWDDEPEKAQEMMKTFVKCGAMCRGVTGMLMRPDVPAIFHAHGVNLRYMSYVHGRIASSAKPCTSHYLEEEMIARAGKQILWRNLRAASSEEARHGACVDFFTGVMQPDGPVAEKFWMTELGPQINKQFDVLAPFDTHALDRELVYRRVAEMCGVSLLEESVESFFGEKPFVQLEQPVPAMKTVHLPQLVESAGELRDFVARQQEGLLMFWAAAPAHFRATPAWAESRPKYLRDMDDDDDDA